MEKRAIVTISIGDQGEKMGEIAHPFMRSYAQITHADFIVIDKPNFKNIFGKFTYEKLNCYSLLDEYDRILFVDSDILIAPDSPCLFSMVAPKVFAASNETAYSMSERDKDVTQKYLGKVDWKYPYFNAGVMLFSKSHKDLFDPEEKKLKTWVNGEFRLNYINLLNDQPYFNHRLNELAYEFLDLTPKFNHTRVIKDTKVRFRSYFIHYAGPSGHRYGNRIEQMSKDANVLNNPILLKISRNFVAYRWVADRIDINFLKYLAQEKLKLTSN